MASAKLECNAAYGRLPFDLYALDHWESTTCAPALPVDHQQRWDELVRRYLRIPLIERWPLYKRVKDLSDKDVLSWPTEEQISEEQISRILAPHQTIQERNLCADEQSVWVRTCYTPSLSQRYLEIYETESFCDREEDHVLDDPLVYSFEGSDQEVLDQILLRLPGLTDANGITDDFGDESVLLYASGKNDPQAIEQMEDIDNDEEKEIYKVGLDVQNFVYVVDADALERNVVKIWWFDEFGKIIWDCLMAPGSYMNRLVGQNLVAESFQEMVRYGSIQRGDVMM